MQGDVSDAKATAALTNYLDDLETVSRLQTGGMYSDTPRNDDGYPLWSQQVLYFIGATKNEPRSHFLRQFIKDGFDPGQGKWTAWERIDLDLQDAHYVTPVAMGRELWLFWMEYREEADQVTQINQQGALPQRKWNIRTKWSRSKSNGGWTSPKVLGISHRPSSQLPIDLIVPYSPEQTSYQRLTLRLLGPDANNTYSDIAEISLEAEQAKAEQGDPTRPRRTFAAPGGRAAAEVGRFR
jgi:hypothetical protein